MAIFIPKEPFEDTKSPGEKAFFYELKRALADEDIYVFHSVKLPAHQNKIFGEADFILVCKNGVIILEVKGGNVECKDGIWNYYDKDGNMLNNHKDPFKQADGNLLAVRTYIENECGITGSYVYTYGVVFPNISFDTYTIEYPKEQICDKNTEDIKAYIYGLLEYKRSTYKHRRNFDEKAVYDIANNLRHDFAFIETLSMRLKKAEKQILRLTNQQSRLIDALKKNDHMLINGSAGSGKTVLAEVYAKTEAEKGKRVLFIAYNKNLVREVSRNLKEYDNIDVFNIHNFFDKIVHFSLEKKEELGPEYYSSYWPNQCIDAILAMTDDEAENFKYDIVVIDEAQDILTSEYVIVIDYFVKNGLKNGRWAMFYDEKQNIYNNELEGGLSLVRSYDTVEYDLTINCRNTETIAAYNSKITETEMPFLLGNEQGEDIEFIGYGNIDELRKQIKQLVKIWNAEKVDKSDVVFLSPAKPSKSDLCAAMGSNFELNILNDDYMPKENVPIYSTIHGFKGLDSHIVVLVDADKLYPTQYKNLLYTAISRAKSKLYIIAKNEALEKLQRS